MKRVIFLAKPPTSGTLEPRRLCVNEVDPPAWPTAHRGEAVGVAAGRQHSMIAIGPARSIEAERAAAERRSQELEQRVIERTSQLTASEERYRHVVDLIREGIWIHVDGKIAYANPYALRMFGAGSPDELIGRPTMSIVHPDDRARAADRTRTLTEESGSVPLTEMKLLRLDGKAMIVALHATQFVQDGKTHVLAAGRDVTAQRDAEAQLHQAQKMESVGQLTGGVAHDFNNLLTVIIGNLDSIVDRVAAEIRPAAESALRAAERGAALIRQMLAFSRRQLLQPQTLDLNDIVSGMGDLLRRTLGEDIEIELKLHGA